MLDSACMSVNWIRLDSQGNRELRDSSGFAATTGRTEAICKAGLVRKAPNSGVMPVK